MNGDAPLTTPYKPATQKMVAACAGVSLATVSHILTGRADRYNEETRNKVLKAVEALEYRPHQGAQSMRKGRSNLIGVINFGGSQYISFQKLTYVVRGIDAEGFHTLVHDVFWFIARDSLATQKMIEAQVEGVLLIHPTLCFTQKHLDVFLKRGIPVVSIGGEHLRGIPRILSDKEKGFCEMTSHLLSLGCRRLTLLLGAGLSEKKRSPSWHRQFAIAGFKRALKAHPNADGIVHFIHNVDLVANDEPHANLYERGSIGMREILDQKTLPEAVLCSNDSLALGALTACADAGLQVPHDLAITGFENEPVGAVGLLPLTTMAHPIKEIAEEASRMLLDCVRRHTMPEESLSIHPSRLVVRRSCGAKLKDSAVGASASSPGK
ncbi:MAG TPA: LacI family DNA-binding transcriptional regulator [Chthoniobacteraceae bacterium]|nr:LacI family DNA-binding transcriptional regulator [Chthoniobacteraceae bacterium]